MNFARPPGNSNESFNVIARGIWRFSVNLPLQLSFEREASTGESSS